MSMKMTGVRSLSPSLRRTTSRVAPSGRWLFAQPASRSTARSMWPFFFQSGSKCGDLFGILMYSTSVGTIDFSNCSSTHFAVASVTDMRGTLTPIKERCSWAPQIWNGARVDRELRDRVADSAVRPSEHPDGQRSVCASRIAQFARRAHGTRAALVVAHVEPSPCLHPPALDH